MPLVPRLARQEEPSRLLVLQSEWRTTTLTDRALRLQLLEEMERRTFHKPLNPFRVDMGPTDTIPVDEPAMDRPYEADRHASYADQRTDHALPFLTEDAVILRACLWQNTRGSTCLGQARAVRGSLAEAHIPMGSRPSQRSKRKCFFIFNLRVPCVHIEMQRLARGRAIAKM